MNQTKAITFEVKKGQDGYYVASAVGFSAITQAKTLDELMLNIKEVIELNLDQFDNRTALVPSFVMQFASETAHA